MVTRITLVGFALALVVAQTYVSRVEGQTPAPTQEDVRTTILTLARLTETALKNGDAATPAPLVRAYRIVRMSLTDKTIANSIQPTLAYMDRIKLASDTPPVESITVYGGSQSQPAPGPNPAPAPAPQPGIRNYPAAPDYSPPPPSPRLPPSPSPGPGRFGR